MDFLQYRLNAASILSRATRSIRVELLIAACIFSLKKHVIALFFTLFGIFFTSEMPRYIYVFCTKQKTYKCKIKLKQIATLFYFAFIIYFRFLYLDGYNDFKQILALIDFSPTTGQILQN